LFTLLIQTSIDLIFPGHQIVANDQIGLGSGPGGPGGPDLNPDPGDPGPSGNDRSVNPNFDSGTLDLTSTNGFSSHLKSRIYDLETRKSRLDKLLFALLSFGVGAIVLNYFLSAWKVRQVVRSVIGIRLIEYEKQLRGLLKDKGRHIEKSLRELEGNVNVIENQIRQNAEQIALTSPEIQYSLYLQDKNARGKVKRETRLTKKRITKNLKKHFEVAKKERADANAKP